MTILFTIFLWKNKWISFCYRITWLELNNPEKLMMTLLKDLLWWFFKNFMQKDKNMDIGIVHPIIIFPQKHHTELDFVFSSKTSQFRSLFFFKHEEYRLVSEIFDLNWRMWNNLWWHDYKYFLQNNEHMDLIIVQTHHHFITKLTHRKRFCVFHQNCDNFIHFFFK